MSIKKHLKVMPISRYESDLLCEAHHYSGRGYVKSQVHLGVFWKGSLEGTMAFGCPIDRRKVLGLVQGTEWGEMCELNRMAFSPALPRNSESRALSVAFRLFKKYAPHVKWILSYADGAQSGSGAIYRATGWLLTQARENKTLYKDTHGRVYSDIGIRTSSALSRKFGREMEGLQLLEGKQYRYIKPLRDNLIYTFEVLDYSHADDG